MIIGVFLYIDASLKGAKLESQGLMRMTLNIIRELSQEKLIKVIVVTPSAFSQELKSTLPKTVEVLSPYSRATFSVRRFTHFLLILEKILLFFARGAILVASVFFLMATCWVFVFSLSELVSDISSSSEFNLRRFLILAVILVALTVLVLRRKALLSLLVRARHRANLKYLTLRHKIWSKGESRPLQQLVEFANKQGASHWLVPSALFGEVEKLEPRYMTIFADSVAFEKPSMAVYNPWIRRVFWEMQRALTNSSAILSISSVVEEHHLPLLVRAKTSKGWFQPSPSFYDCASREKSSDAKETTFEGLRQYVVFPTQARPYKNIANLVRALNLLGMHEVLDLRLVLTCSREQLESVTLETLDLSRIKFLPNISDDMLYELIANSEMAISASAFEANIPYTFGEAVQARVPALLADIESTRQALGSNATKAPFDKMLFDPNNPIEIAGKILWAYKNRDKLLDAQLVFFREIYGSKRMHSEMQKLVSILGG
jgi:glycosyltransferase involved in cell wall biosynthesis